jgi:hypothetical protein
MRTTTRNFAAALGALLLTLTCTLAAAADPEGSPTDLTSPQTANRWPACGRFVLGARLDAE